MSKDTIISPIAIDLGAKNTGVYFAHYKAGSAPEDIDREGTVYQLDQNSYTLLMANRTVARHQRRCYDRRQMAKRLFKLIWEEHFKLEWNESVQQTISFLMNRRGFTHLTEEYDAEVLKEFPKEAYDELPKELRKGIEQNGDYWDFASALTEWANAGEEKVKNIFNKVLLQTYRASIYEVCSKKKSDTTVVSDRNLEKLTDTPKDIFEILFEDFPKLKNRIETEEYTFQDKKDTTKTITAKYNKGETVNILSFINNESVEIANKIISRTEEKKEWLFNPTGSFDLEKSMEKLRDPENIDVKLHLRHLAFALYKANEELKSGGRHRSKYFREIKEVLKDKNHTHKYLKKFCEQLTRGDFKHLDAESLANLIGHISNLELKPLRKYFHNEGHRTEDYWSEKGDKKKKIKGLNEIFENWILKEWRVDLEKDKLKKKDEPGDYQELKEKWKNKKTPSVVDFWLDNDPNLTIPPYQDNNNRRPPKCQSLVFNVQYLKDKYPKWQQWLRKLKEMPEVKDYLDRYEIELKELKSRKGNSYFGKEKTGKLCTDSGRRSEEELQSRIFHFILDRVKSEDPLNLNEIYSQAKGYKQNKRDKKDISKYKEGLETAIAESKLPDDLKTLRDYKDDGIFPEGGFLHLVCKYYKLRQRARDGRIYIHPEYRFIKGRGYENTGRFDNKEHFLTYCNHKPRQKRYQTLGDLAGLLQISSKNLESFVKDQNENSGEIDEKLFEWLNGIEGLKTNCKNATKEQKGRRGRLKLDIQNVFGLVYRKIKEKKDTGNFLSWEEFWKNPVDTDGKPLKDPEVKKILKKSKVEDAYKLYTFCNRAKNLCLEITEHLYSNTRQEEWKKDLNRNPATAVYFLAQINNMVFKERSGNAKTCAVCSLDNAMRMQIIESKDNQNSTAKASRLPAIYTRIIDGAVMRMARIVGGAIAKDKWKKIKKELNAGKEVRVPIITESNRFEFEPDLKTLKGKSLTSKDKEYQKENQESKPLVRKDERIRQASQGICPYTGNPLQGGDKDHIIPCSSEWGTLNDEANLIWASDKGNKEIKRDQSFSLSDLKPSYKERQFGHSDDNKITKWIEEQIGNGSSGEFKFGSYRSFVNLTPDQQKAFRHALFLKCHSLREKVISAINNRTRTLVNGTQRYFAEVLANEIYKLARKESVDTSLLDFDYFGVEAWTTSRGEGVRELRKMYQNADLISEEYAKSTDAKQKSYSHLLDAMFAFVIVADAHRNEGGLKINIDDSVRKEPFDLKTGEIYRNGNMLEKIQISDEKFMLCELKRLKAYDVETYHREQLVKGYKPQKIPYKIHRDNFLAVRFMPLLLLDSGDVKKGFSLKNSVEHERKDFEKIRRFLTVSQNKKYYIVKRKDAFHFLLNIGDGEEASKEQIQIAKLLEKLTYQTIKKEIKSVLTIKNKPNTLPRTVSDALANWNMCITKKSFTTKDGVILSLFYEWEKLKRELENANPEQDLQEFLRSSRVFDDKQNGSIKKHNKKRKVYSLPITASIGNIRLKRRSWDGEEIIQVAADESLAKYGYKGNERPHTILSKNSIPIKHYSGLQKKWAVEPLEWKSIPDEFIKEYNKKVKKPIIKSGKLISKDAGRCTVRLTVDNIDNISLPQDKQTWKGKLFRYDDSEECREKSEQEKGSNIHYLASDWQWFGRPFELPKNRNEVEIRKSDGVYKVEFTIQKTAPVREWLLA